LLRGSVCHAASGNKVSTGHQLPVVFAYRDNGPVLLVRTNWSPRRVFCTMDQNHSGAPGLEYVVKFRQGKPGAAALISEVVCACLFEIAGVHVPEVALVHVRAALADSYTRSAVAPYPVEPGLHFGTRFIANAYPGPPTTFQQIADPQQLVDIWVVDCWVMNVDRMNYGNILMSPDGRGRWRLTAADQSDCFGGSRTFSSGSAPYATRGCLEPYKFLERAVTEAGGIRSIRKSIDGVRKAAGYLELAITRIPDSWWSQSGVIPGLVIDGLRQRASRIEEIIKVAYWEGISDAGRGGTVLDL